jgi:hypothetical protein
MGNAIGPTEQVESSITCMIEIADEPEDMQGSEFFPMNLR